MFGSVEDRVVEAVRQILLQLHTISPEPFPQSRISKIQREVIFYLYEGGAAAKWDVRRPHSKAARALRNAGLKGASFEKQITYEHAIPLATLQAELRDCASSFTRFRELLNRRVRGVVILRTENQKLRDCGLNDCLPLGAPPHDLLARYRLAGIELEPEDLRILTAGI